LSRGDSWRSEPSKPFSVFGINVGLTQNTAKRPNRNFGLSRPNLGLDHTDIGRPRCPRWFEVQLQRFLQVGESLFFGLALAGDIDLQAQGDVPLPLTPNGRGEWSLRDLVLSQGDGASHGRCRSAPVWFDLAVTVPTTRFYFR
jgi:hypothetical protein